MQRYAFFFFKKAAAQQAEVNKVEARKRRHAREALARAPSLRATFLLPFLRDTQADFFLFFFKLVPGR